MDDPAGYVHAAEGKVIGSLHTARQFLVGQDRSQGRRRCSRPIDLQAVKAAGVTVRRVAAGAR